MKNPLNNRIKRKFSDEKIKYASLLLFFSLVIGFCSGTIVTTDNLSDTYDKTGKMYKLEDGNLTMKAPLDKQTIDFIEKEDNIKLYKNFNIEKKLRKKSGSKKHLGKTRVFRLADRRSINKICIYKGEAPKNKDEIMMDRLYCENNNIEIGDYIYLGDYRYRLTGYTAFPDYSCLFSDNEDIMFDAMEFNVAAVTKAGFKRMNKAHIFYNYSWKYNKQPASISKEKKESERVLKTVCTGTAALGNEIYDFIPAFTNKAITFTDKDFL